MKALRIVCVVALVIGIAAFAWAQDMKRTAKITSLEGSAEVKLAGDSNWFPAKVGTVLNEGDTIKTAANSKVLMNVGEKAEVGIVEVSEKSQLQVAEMKMDAKEDTSKTLLDLAMGEVLIKAQKVHGDKSRFEVKTPTSIVGVRGTTFKVKVEAVEE